MQQGGSLYGAPPPPQQQPQQQQHPEAAPPISARPPPPGDVAPNYEDLRVAVADEHEGGGGGISGNRWPRQETLALLKIRSDMDAAFRDATLKGPLWEEVSRKLEELGYRRSAKKCKEKFENVHKYYKRTKEGRAGRQDGKSYRFFSQLEALHNITSSGSPSPIAPHHPVPSLMSPDPPISAAMFSPVQAATPPPPRPQPIQIPAPPPPIPTAAPPPPPAGGFSFSSNTDTSSGFDDDEDDEATEEGPSSGGGGGGRKRKRESGGPGMSRKMMAFFEGLMRQVMERQEAMQQRFLDAIEKREQDRMIRDEAWRRQEMSRLSREHDLAAHERAASASRDSAIISFLQKLSGPTAQLPPPAAPTSLTPTSIQPPPPPPAQQHQIQQHQHQQQTPPPPAPQPQIQQQQALPPPSQAAQAQTHHVVQQQQQQEIIRQHHHQTPQPSTELVPMMTPEQQEGSAALVSVSHDPASSRWPKSEVHDLIKMRSELDSRYQESGPKGPLWEEISAAMRRLGYSRSAKRCKEKWENINKYFKKVKESNKKRPDDAKTCPYFHQLDALYRSKLQLSGGPPALPQIAFHCPNPTPTPISMIAPPPQHQGEAEIKNVNLVGAETGGGAGPINGGVGVLSFFGEGTGTGGGGDNSGVMKKPEDIVKELMGHSNSADYGCNDAAESNNMDEDDDYDEEDDDDEGKGQYMIQFQRPVVENTPPASGSAAPPSSTAAATGGKSSGSFLAMVR